MCYRWGQYISTELQSLTGFCMMTDYLVHFYIITELQSLTGIPNEIRYLEQFIMNEFLFKMGTLGQKCKEQASFLTQILPLK